MCNAKCWYSDEAEQLNLFLFGYNADSRWEKLRSIRSICRYLFLCCWFLERHFFGLFLGLFICLYLCVDSSFIRLVHFHFHHVEQRRRRNRKEWCCLSGHWAHTHQLFSQQTSLKYPFTSPRPFAGLYCQGHHEQQQQNSTIIKQHAERGSNAEIELYAHAKYDYIAFKIYGYDVVCESLYSMRMRESEEI